jgi:hypothetical protein
MFSLKFVTYSGMTIPMGEGMDRAEARRKVQMLKRRAARLGQPHSYLGNGQWEFETPEEAAGISDMDGWLIAKASRP